MAKSIDKIINDFAHGSFTYTCYSYMEKLHIEPRTWIDLFEFLDYSETASKINELISGEQERKK